VHNNFSQRFRVCLCLSVGLSSVCLPPSYLCRTLWLRHVQVAWPHRPPARCQVCQECHGIDHPGTLGGPEAAETKTSKPRAAGEVGSEKLSRLKPFFIALRPQTPKHIRGGWSHNTDISAPVDGNGAQKMVTVQSRFQTTELSITGPTRLPTDLTGPGWSQQ
jgi:hypothetical protein